jgi:hypothetical protein
MRQLIYLPPWKGYLALLRKDGYFTVVVSYGFKNGVTIHLNFTLPLILLTNFSSLERSAETLECSRCVRPSVLQ